MLLNNQPVLPVSVYRFYFTTTKANQLPPYAGSAWRGAFGHALKRTVCVVRNTPCNQCLLKQACAYSYIFETAPPDNSEKMRKYTAAPHPFVLRLPRTCMTNENSYPLDIILFGHAQRYLPYIIHAMQTAGLDGIGGHRQAFELEKIDAINLSAQATPIYQQGTLLPLPAAELPHLPSMPTQIEISLLSPLRIKQAQKT
jgi:hypothetical protein